LSKRKGKSFYAERFEVYLGGMELANAFSELTDADEQLRRLKEEQEQRRKMKKDFIPIDKDFIFSLKLGLPRSGGIALGVERLQMLLLGIKDINDLLLFPEKNLFKQNDKHI
jgi:lysyl-tRNA synthetase class 2